MTQPFLPSCAVPVFSPLICQQKLFKLVRLKRSMLVSIEHSYTTFFFLYNCYN